MEKVLALTQQIMAIVTYHEEDFRDIITDSWDIKGSDFCKALQDAEKIGSADELLDAAYAVESCHEEIGFEEVLHALDLFEDDQDKSLIFYHLLATYILTDKDLLDAVNEEVTYCRRADPELWEESMELCVLSDEQIDALTDWCSEEF